MLRKNWWIFLLLPPLGAAIGLVVAASYTYVHPRIYESNAIIEVRLPSNVSSGTEHDHSRAMATEMAKIKSHGVLAPVIADLELTTLWNLEANTALAILEERIIVTQIPNTDLVSIRARFTNKVDARDIVDSIVKSYRHLRISAVGKQAAARMEEINKLLRDQEDRVEERRKIVSIIVRNKQSTIDETKTIIAPIKGESQEDARKRVLDTQDYLDAKRELENEMTLLQSIKIKQMEETISAGIPDQLVTIHSPPIIADSPILPNVSLNLMYGIGFGFFVGIPISLLILFLMPRRGAENLSSTGCCGDSIQP